MDINRHIAELRRERDALDGLIRALEYYGRVQGGVARRGRPPNWMKKAHTRPRSGWPLGSKNRGKRKTKAKRVSKKAGQPVPQHTDPGV